MDANRFLTCTRTVYRVDNDEIFVHHRARDPYITLERAKELHRIEVKFGHLGRIKGRQDRLEQEQTQRDLRERLFDVGGDSE